MASVMMAVASCLAGLAMAKQPLNARHRGLIVAKASNGSEGQRVNVEMKMAKESNNRRRDLVAAIAAAAFSLARVAMADDEPARGTPEAKKKYGPVCVAYPTARICRK